MPVMVYQNGSWRPVSDGGGEPPVERTMLVGGAFRPFPGPEFDDYNSDCGPVRCVRRYDNRQGVPVRFSDRDDFTYIRNNDMGLAFSFKYDHSQLANGQWDNRIVNFVSTWPSDVPGWLLIDNEPDQNSKGLNPATFRAAVEHLHSVLGAHPRPNVKLGIALMQWTFREQLNDDTAGVEWLPNVDELFVDIHCYGRHQRLSPQRYLGTFMQRMAERPLWTWGVGEVNCYEDDNDVNAKADWFTTNADWCYDHGSEFWLPFDVVQDISYGVRTSPQATAAMKAISTKYDAGPQ